MTAYFKLQGRHFEMFHQSIMDLFSYDELNLLLRCRVDKRLSSITGPGGMNTVVLEVINTAEQQMWLDDLVLAMSEARPGHPVLEQLVEEVGLGATMTTDDREGLERFYQGIGGFLDLAVVGRLERAVCQIAYRTNTGKQFKGTGFLVAPDIVMTNYHVIEQVIDNQASYTDVKALFDYKLNADGVTINPGTAYALSDDDPLLDSSRYSDQDLVFSAQPQPTSTDKLDYAMLRLKDAVGSLPIPSKAGSEADPAPESLRGWIGVDTNPLLPGADSPLLIIQHPAGEPLKVAFKADSIIASNPTGTRTRHRTSTLEGSSGAPCFDARWHLVGLHNGADPQLNKPAQYNQMVPIKAIRSRLESNNKLHLITG